MKKIKRIISRCLGCICVLLFSFMTCLAFYQVTARYVFGKPSTVSEDLLSFSFIWLSLLGSALVFGERGHMKLSYFAEEKASPQLQVCLSVLAELFVLVMAIIVFCWGGSGFVGVGILQQSPTLGISLGWMYAILPLSGILMVLYSILNIFELVSEYRENTGGASR